MAPQAASGAFSVNGVGLETIFNTYAAPTYWLFPESDTTAVIFDQLAKDVQSGGLNAARIFRVLKGKITGTWTYPLFATHGAPILLCAMGNEATYIAAGAADTVLAATPVTTTAGISTIKVTNTAGVTNYQSGNWITINTSTASEARQVLTGTNAAGGTITVGALKGNATAAAGTAVQLMGQHKLIQNPTSLTVRSFSLEGQYALQWAWQLAGCLVSKWNCKVTNQQFQVTTTWSGSKINGTITGATGLTAVNPSTEENSDLIRPFAIPDSMFVGYQDPLQAGGVTGTSVQESMGTYLTDFELDMSNALIEVPFHDGSQYYRVFPGVKGPSTIKYTYVMASGRFSEFQDYVANTANTTIPFFAGAAYNTANTGAMNWRGVGFYVPNLFLTVGTPQKVTNQLHTCLVEGKLTPPSGSGDSIQTFVMNEKSVVY